MAATGDFPRDLQHDRDARMTAPADPLTYAGPFAGELAKLLVENPLSDTHRWAQARRDAIDFLAIWGEQAAELGWTAQELFGLDPVAPLARYDVMGLIWLLGGKKVTELTKVSAKIGSTRFYRLKG